MTKLFDKLVAMIWDFVAVKRSSWHYKLLNFLSDNGDLTTDPATYWITFGPVILLLWIIRTIFTILMWVAGFSRDTSSRENDWMPSLLPYGKFQDGTTKMFLPYYLLAIDIMVWEVRRWKGDTPDFLMLVGLSIPLLFIRGSSTKENKPGAMTPPAQ